MNEVSRLNTKYPDLFFNKDYNTIEQLERTIYIGDLLIKKFNGGTNGVVLTDQIEDFSRVYNNNLAILLDSQNDYFNREIEIIGNRIENEYFNTRNPFYSEFEKLFEENPNFKSDVEFELRDFCRYLHEKPIEYSILDDVLNESSDDVINSIVKPSVEILKGIEKILEFRNIK